MMQGAFACHIVPWLTGLARPIEGRGTLPFQVFIESVLNTFLLQKKQRRKNTEFYEKIADLCDGKNSFGKVFQLKKILAFMVWLEFLS